MGSVRAAVDSDTCFIGRLIVHPDLQGKGIGTVLMKEIELAFPEARQVELFTGTKSTDNIRLYKKARVLRIPRRRPSPRVRIVFLEKLR